MEIELIAVLTVVILVGVSILARQIGVAAPLLLIVVGMGVGYLPFMPDIRVNPEIILVGVLPPLLYSAAVNTPLIDFRRNIRPIAGLSIVLVLFSAFAVGGLLHLAIPSIPFPVALALGAVISPTDAVAATSIGKRLGMPDRLVAILEGESLVNDATSLVLLKTALAAVAGSFAFWGTAGTFAYAVAAAILIGTLIGIATVWIRSFFKNPVYDTVVSYAVPFLAFVPAEMVQASGVLSVVVTGLYTGHHAARKFSATARMNERLNWRTLQFLIENGVFLLMGLELRTLVEEVGGDGLRVEHLPVIALGLVAVLILTRALFTAPLLMSMRRDLHRHEARIATAPASDAAREARLRNEHGPERARRRARREERRRADLAHERDRRLGWRDGVVLSWSGMRGVVTLAAAQSIPTSVPYRPQIVLLAFLVAAVTLLLHGLTLPPLITRLWPDGSRASDDRNELAALGQDLIEAGNAALDEELADPAHDGESFPAPSEQVVGRVRAGTRNALARLAIGVPGLGGAKPGGPPHRESPTHAYFRLSRVVLDAQRAALLEERAIGRYSSRALRAAETALDLHETRLGPAA